MLLFSMKSIIVDYTQSLAFTGGFRNAGKMLVQPCSCRFAAQGSKEAQQQTVAEDSNAA